LCELLQNLGGVQEMEELRTATYCAVLQKGGELLFGIGDMDIHNHITPEYVSMDFIIECVNYLVYISL
jgi:hypothetical protein